MSAQREHVNDSSLNGGSASPQHGGAEPRPRRLTVEMAHAVALQLAKQLAERSEIDEGEIEPIANSIAEVVGSCTFADGFEIARDLANEGLEPNAAWVEVLDGWSSRAFHQISVAEKEWGTRNPMTPPFPVGAHVLFAPNKETGVISRVHEFDPAKYLISVDGDPRLNSFRVVNFEDVIDLAPAAAGTPKLEEVSDAA